MFHQCMGRRWAILFAWLLVAGSTSWAYAQPSHDLPPLTSVHSIRLLSTAEAKLGRPIHIRGQVTVLSGWKDSFFVQDSTGGISVDRQEHGQALAPGDLVDILGMTGPGLFAPVILSKQIERVGHKALPAAPLRRFDELVGGQQDSQWMEVRGTVRSASTTNSWGQEILLLDLNLGGGSISVRVHNYAIKDPQSLVDAEVSVRGVCGSNFNERRQFVGLRLFVTNFNDVRILRSAPADPFSRAPEPLGSVLRFNPNGIAQHRVTVSGTITYYLPGHMLYLQDGETGVYVSTDQTTPAAAGDQVEVVGFSAVGGYSPILESAIFRVVGHHTAPKPLLVAARQVITTDDTGFKVAPYDGRLITVRGTLLEKLGGSDGQVLLLLDDRTPFRARLAGFDDQNSLDSIENRSFVEITGVCSVRSDVYHEPRSFELQMRSPADLVVLKSAPWWSLRHTLSVLAVVFSVALAAVFWIGLLRRQVLAQTAIIQKNMETIQHSEERLRTILSNVRDYAIWTLDPEGNVTSWNEGGQRMMQYTPEEIIGKNYSIIFTPEDIASGRPMQQLKEAEVKGSSFDEGWRYRKDGTLYWASVVTNALYDSTGKPRGFVRITRDMTERRRAEEAVARAQQEQLKIKDQVLAHVSHELRTPVAAITWFAGNLQEGLLGPMNVEQQEHLEGIERNASQLAKMIEDILNSSRIEEGKVSIEPNAISVGHLIEEVLASCEASARAKFIAMRSEISADLPMAWADAQRTGQVIINLVNNAIKFTQPHGSVLVTAARDEGTPEMLRITVKDNGPGISAEDQERVFSRLVQLGETDDAGRKGLGLGLFISREFVTRQGGTISIESALGQGAAFSFTLPIASLERTVTELLGIEPRQDLVLRLMCIDLVGGASQLENSRLEREIRSALEECIRKGQDMLLPTSNRGGSNSFFILTCAEASGLNTMRMRIQHELALNETLMEAAAQPKITSQRIELDESTHLEDERIHWISIRVGEAIRAHEQSFERERHGEKDIAGRR
jgi:PAS domain S-box-containing protein